MFSEARKGEAKFLVIDSLNAAAQIMHCWLIKYSGEERREAESWVLKYQSCYKIQSEIVEGGLTMNQLIILQGP